MHDDGLRLGIMDSGDGMTANVDASARYSLSCSWSGRLEDTLGPDDDDDGGGVSSMAVGGCSFPVCAECQCHR
jgi:hypothetical protein